MKTRYIIAPLLMAATIAATNAQSFNLREGNVTYRFPAATVGNIDFSPSGALTALGCNFQLTDATEMWVDDTQLDDNMVKVVYSGDKAEVAVAGNVAKYVTVAIDGSKVTVTQSDEVSADNCGEITYSLSGSSSDGSFYLAGSFKATVELDGLNLTSASGAPIDIQNGKRINLKLVDGSNNTLTDAVSGSQKGCIVCKGHLEIKGTGELKVAGNASHAIYAKEYIELSKANVTVTKAAKDGVNCNQYFLMKSGSLTIDAFGDDGIQVSYKDDTDREAEDTGAVTVSGGTLSIKVSADAAKGIKCEGDMAITDGKINITVSGNGIYDSAKAKTKASACLGSDLSINISGGSLDLTATGGGGKGINCDDALLITGGDITIKTSGGVVAYVNGSLNNNYTGNTDRLDSDMKSSPKGVKADGNINIEGGNVSVTTTGNGAEGIESKSILTISDGVVTVKATDDAINSASHMYIKGGTITVVSTGNDGLDSNGNMYIEGGYIMAYGSRSPECGIDANEEGGFSVVFSGGTLLGIGGNNSVPSSKSGSTQPYITGSNSVSAGTVITLSDTSGNILAEFTVPDTYTSSTGGFAPPEPMFAPSAPMFAPGGGPGGMGGSGLLITCPGLVNGSSYTLKCGSSSSSVTAKTTGSSSGPGGWW